MPIFFRSSLTRIYIAVQCLSLLVFTTATPVTNITRSILTLSNNDIGVQCTKAQTWVADGFNQQDCIGIIDYIWTKEALERDSQEYEFVSLGATSKTDLPKIMTPRKYEMGTCVVIIAMLDQFQPQELPGSDFRKRYEATDVAMFEGVWDAAAKIDFKCGPREAAGWVAMGKQYFVLSASIKSLQGVGRLPNSSLPRKLKTDVEMLLGNHGSIGVLMMKSGSAEDKNIPDGPPQVQRVVSAPSGLIESRSSQLRKGMAARPRG